MPEVSENFPPIGQFWIPSDIVPAPTDVCFGDVDSSTRDEVADNAGNIATLQVVRNDSGLRLGGWHKSRVFGGGGL